MTKYLMMVAVSVFPLLSSAATYHYVTTEGVTASIEASSAQEALITAPNIASNSGVAIDAGVIESGMDIDAATHTDANGQHTYHYVTADGITALVTAPNPTAALRDAPNRATHSGVALDVGIIEVGMEVQSVAD